MKIHYKTLKEKGDRAYLAKKSLKAASIRMPLKVNSSKYLVVTREANSPLKQKRHVDKYIWAKFQREGERLTHR